MRVDNVEDDKYKKLENLLSIFDGDVQVIVFDKSNSKYLSTNMGISLSPYVLKEIQDHIGEENVALR